MNAKKMSLALAAMALLSTGSAFAQSVDVGPVGVSVGPTPGTVLMSPVHMGTRLVHEVFNPPHAWFDLSVLGMGLTIGGHRDAVQVGSTPSAMLTTPVVGSDMTVLESARVIPGTPGIAVPVGARIEAPKPLLHLDLFGARLIRAGSVAPSMDMRDD
jgi:hypothetical protein